MYSFCWHPWGAYTHSEECEEWSVQWLLYSLICVVCSVQCAVCSMQCAVCSLQCALCEVEYEVFNIQCTVYCVKGCEAYDFLGGMGLLLSFFSFLEVLDYVKDVWNVEILYLNTKISGAFFKMFSDVTFHLETVTTDMTYKILHIQ